jgi:hypothetical protein
MRSSAVKSSIVFAVFCTVVSAGPIITFNEATGNSGANQNQSVGWQFDVLTALTVTSLGWFDEGQDGLTVAHEVGIWDSAGSLLTSVTVPAGTVAPLDGQYRMVTITPLLLAVGGGYIIGGQNFSNNTERLAYDVSQNVDSRIQFIDATFSDIDGIFERPTALSVANTGFYGPMFAAGDIGDVNVPEPRSLFLTLSGAVFLALWRFRGRLASLEAKLRH